jgi:hypothetical protein
MKSRARCTLASLIAVQNFLKRHRPELLRCGPCSPRHKLDHAIAVLTARLDSYDTAVIKGPLDTDRRWELRNEIREALRPVITIARTLLYDTPELAVLRLPATGASAGLLISMLYQLADVVTRHCDAFEGEGLATGTGDRLRALARRLNVAVIQRDIARHVNRRTRREISIAMRRGREAEKLLAAMADDEAAAQRSLH